MMDDFESSIYKHSRTIIHIDIDCFYAQCEMLKNPELVNKPLGVKQKNYIITSNYVAREFGIKKCMLIPEALSLCPELVIVNGEDLYDYRKMSSSVTEVIKGFASKVEKLGFDENFVDVSELVSTRLQEESQNIPSEFAGHVYKNIVKNKCTCGCNGRLKLGSVIAKEMRDKIREVLQLTCSAGIGHNKLVAKLVGSEHKPDQQTTILPSGVLALMSTLSNVQEIPGIGRKTSDVMNKLNIKTIVDIQNCSLHELERHLGRSASEWIVKSSFGIDDSEVKISGKPQTLSVEDAVKRINSIEDVQTKFSNLIGRLLVLIREDGRLPTTVKITLRMSGTHKREMKQCVINPNIVNCEKASTEILVIAMQMFKAVIDQTKPFHLTLVGIGFTKFKDVFTGKNSIASFFQKSASCEVLNSGEEINDIDKTITEMTEIASDFYEEDNFQNDERIHNQYRYSEIPAKSEQGNISSTTLSVNENRRTFLPTQDISNLQKKCENKLTDEELAVFCNILDRNNQYSNTSEVLNCPEGFDAEVFSQLPVDIRQELIQNQRTQTQQTNTTVNEPKTITKTNSIKKLNDKSKVLKKKKLSSGQSNKIRNYFSKS